MRYPVKFVMLTTFATPLLAAYGMRKVLSASPEAKAGIRRFLIVLWLAMLSLILIILWVAHRSPSGRETWTITARNGVERAAFLSLVLATLYRMNRTRESGKQCLLGLAVLVLLWLDIVTHAPSQNPTVERTVYEPGLQPLRELDPRPTLGQSRAMTSYSALWRFHFTLLSDPFNTQLGCRLGLFADCNLLDGLPKVDGFYAIEIKEEFEARETLYLSTNTVPENYMNKDFLSRGIFYVATNNFATNLADFLGVCQITAPGKLFDWEARPTYLPLLSAGQKPVFVDATNSLRGLLEPAFNPRQVVYLPLEARPFITVPNETQARVFPGEFSAHGAVLETVAEAPTMVVAAQAWYPCWKAYVDGQPARVWRANHAYQALQVPGGRHRVELVYRDPSFLSGLAISGLTLIACVIGAFRRK